MSLIPAELRSNPVSVQPASWRLRDLLAVAGAAATVGLAGGGTVAVGGVEAQAASGGSGAVGVTRLRQAGGRIYGRPCRGLAAAPTQGMSLQFNLGGQPNAATGTYRSGSFTAPVTGSMIMGGSVDNYLTLNGQKVLSYGEGNNIQSHNRLVTAGEVFQWAAVNTGGFAGGNFWVSFSEGPEALLNKAVAALAWASAGLPWAGTIDAAARAGAWVRRSTWTDAARRVRFVQGAGTTSAVAVDQAGAVLTTAGFGAAEWLAEDWELVDGGEPPEVDVTDWVFTGPAGAVPFAVAGASAGGGTTPRTDPGTGGGGGTDPGTGGGGGTTGHAGFVYRKADGTEVVVPGEDFATGGVWTP